MSRASSLYALLFLRNVTRRVAWIITRYYAPFYARLFERLKIWKFETIESKRFLFIDEVGFRRSTAARRRETTPKTEKSKVAILFFFLRSVTPFVQRHRFSRSRFSSWHSKRSRYPAAFGHVNLPGVPHCPAPFSLGNEVMEARLPTLLSSPGTTPHLSLSFSLALSLPRSSFPSLLSCSFVLNAFSPFESSQVAIESPCHSFFKREIIFRSISLLDYSGNREQSPRRKDRNCAKGFGDCCKFWKRKQRWRFLGEIMQIVIEHSDSVLLLFIQEWDMRASIIRILRLSKSYSTKFYYCILFLLFWRSLQQLKVFTSSHVDTRTKYLLKLVLPQLWHKADRSLLLSSIFWRERYRAHRLRRPRR